VSCSGIYDATKPSAGELRVVPRVTLVDARAAKWSKHRHDEQRRVLHEKSLTADGYGRYAGKYSVRRQTWKRAPARRGLQTPKRGSRLNCGCMHALRKIGGHAAERRHRDRSDPDKLPDDSLSLSHELARPITLARLIVIHLLSCSSAMASARSLATGKLVLYCVPELSGKRSRARGAHK